MSSILEVVKASKGNAAVKASKKSKAPASKAEVAAPAKPAKGKPKKDAIVTANSRGVRASWRGFGACALLRYLAAQGFGNPQARFILDNIGLADVSDFTIGCQCRATRSAMSGTTVAKGVSKVDAAKGVSFRGVPADVKGENAAFLRAVAKRMPATK